MLRRMMLQAAAAAALLMSAPTSATTLYLTDQLEHGITTLELTGSDLVVKAITPGCGATPTWVTQDSASNRLFCMDETQTNGTISSYRTEEDGSLSRLNTITTQPGAVHGVLFGQGNGLAVAHHVGSTVATYDVSKWDTKTLKLVQQEIYHLSKEESHPVGGFQQAMPQFALTDPSGKFLLVADPGAGRVWTYLLSDEGQLRFTDLPPLVVAGGPRHAAFVVLPTGTVYLYITTEESNMIRGYKMLYTSSTTIEFTDVYEEKASTDSHDVGGDIQISPDSKFLLISYRGSATITIPGTSTTPEIKSDPIITYSIDQSHGNLTKIQTFAAGGKNPRQFSVSQDGSMVAVSLFADESKKVTILARDVHTGKLTKQIAELKVGGWPSCVIFKDENLLSLAGKEGAAGGAAADTSHLLLNKKWVFFSFFGVVFFVWAAISCCMRGRRKIAWYLEQRKYSRIGRQDFEGEELEETLSPTGTVEGVEQGVEEVDKKAEAARFL